MMGTFFVVFIIVAVLALAGMRFYKKKRNVADKPALYRCPTCNEYDCDCHKNEPKE